MPLHPQAQSFLEQLAASEAPAWHELPPRESREIFAGLKGVFGLGPELWSVEDHKLEQVPVRIYRPSDRRDLPAIMYFHGGGWVLGNLDTHDSLCRRFAAAANAVVISVDYRLSPESRYPDALEDCYLATSKIAAGGRDFGLDSQRLVVAGDSAGGNLAAAVALQARDHAGPELSGQVLIYPVIEPDFDTESYQAFATDHGLSRESMQWFWEQYLGEAATDVKYARLAAANVAGLPPTHVVTAEFDVLRSEGEQFAQRLAAANVKTSHQRYAGMLHGFVHFAGMFDTGKTAIQEIGQIVQQLVADP